MISKRKYVSNEELTLMGIPFMYQGCTWNDYDFSGKDALKNVLVGYTEHCADMYNDNISLLLAGSNGCGKSFASSILLQQCYINYFSARFITFKELITKTFNNDDTSSFFNADFLVLDELGAEVNLKSSSEKSLLEELLKYRFSKNLPTIVCTNLTLKDIQTRYGNTVHSMFLEYIKIDIVGEDFRRNTLKKKDAIKYLRG